MAGRGSGGAASQASADAVFRSIAESSPDSIMLLDREGRIEFINRTARGLTVASVIGTLVYQYVPADQHAAMRACFERVADTGAPGTYENIYRSADGVVSLWESRVAALSRGGRVTGFVVMASDVTERRATLLDRDRFFQLSLDMMCVAGLDGYFKQVNPALVRGLGWSEAELLARPLADFVHPQDRDSTDAALETLRHGRDVTDFENRYRRADGSYRTFEWYATLDEATQRVHGVARDVTDQRALRHQLMQAQKMDAIGQLAGGVAHDFNNLMMAVLANVRFALERIPADSELREYLVDVERGAERAVDLTRQLLALSRRDPLQRVAVDLAELAQQMMRMLRRVIPEDIALALAVDDERPLVAGDRSQLEQVLLNLCLNARDAVSSGGCIEIAVRSGRAREGGAVCVELHVVDDGVGMAPEIRERAFEPFFTTKPAGRGSGLGLATVYGIVQQHGGTVHVDSEPGMGTKVRIELPAAEETTAAAPPAAPLRSPSGGETILVAEDESLVREVVVHMLRRAGYRVLAAADGAEAVASFEANPDGIDLVLLDMVMPSLGGADAYAAMARIRADLPVLFTSGYADRSHFSSSVPPAARLLEKPYLAEELLHAVRRILDDAAARPAPS
jgi:PAS domain S-box-containing protein